MANKQIIDKKSIKRAELMLLGTLYRNPLYHFSESGPIRVLIFGCGNYGKEAFKAVFSQGQLAEIVKYSKSEKKFGSLVRRALRITIVDKDKSQWENFVETMPALKDFASFRTIRQGGEISQCPEHCEDKLADIVFLEQDILENELSVLLKRVKPCYILCCLGTDDLNQSLAKTVSENIEGEDKKPYIGYIVEQDVLTSVPLADPIRPVANYAEINPDLIDMAFNVHYLYERSGHERLPMDKIELGFRKEYNKRSNIAFAVHVGSKLASVGIDLQKEGLLKAAEKFDKICSSSEGKSVVTYLSFLEHCRWLANNIIAGYTAPPNGDLSYMLESFSHILTDNKKGIKYHPALVMSSSSSVTLKGFDWDHGDVNMLDALDKASVVEYRFCRKNITAGDNLLSMSANRIDIIVSKRPESNEAFEGLRKMIDLINQGAIYGARKFAIEYTRFSNFLQNSKELFSKSECEELESELKKLKNSLFFKMGVLLRKDYKKYDNLLVRRLPLIMKRRGIAVYCGLSGRKSNCLQSIHTALTLEAEKIVWIEHIEADQLLCAEPANRRLRALLRLFRNVMVFHDLRAFFSEYELHIIVSDVNCHDDMVALEECFESYCIENELDKRKITLHFTDVSSDVKSCTSKIIRNCEHRNSRKKKPLIGLNGFERSSVMSEVLTTEGITHVTEYADCAIKKHLSVSEYMRLFGAKVFSDSFMADSVDYKLLWGLYSTKELYKANSLNISKLQPEYIWTLICGAISEAIKPTPLMEGENYLIPYELTFKQDLHDGLHIADTELSIEILQDELVNYLLTELEREGIIFDMKMISSDSLFRRDKLKLGKNRYTVRFKFLTNSKGSEIIPNIICAAIKAVDGMNGQYIPVINYNYERRKYCISKEPVCFTLEKFNDNLAKYKQVLVDALVEYGFLEKNISTMNETIYNFPKPIYRHLLRTEGALLELFICRAMADMDEFTDLVMNMSFRWDIGDPSSTTNEIDCVGMTDKGDAVFVSAKSGFEMKPEFIYQIAAISAQFGAKGILVTSHSSANVSKITHASRSMREVTCITRRDFDSEKRFPPAQINNGHPDLDALAKQLEKAAEGDRLALIKAISAAIR